MAGRLQTIFLSIPTRSSSNFTKKINEEIFNFYNLNQKNQQKKNFIRDIIFKKKLKCQNFRWFLENVFNEKFIPDENCYASGEVLTI